MIHQPRHVQVSKQEPGTAHIIENMTALLASGSFRPVFRRRLFHISACSSPSLLGWRARQQISVGGGGGGLLRGEFCRMPVGMFGEFSLVDSPLSAASKANARNTFINTLTFAKCCKRTWLIEGRNLLAQSRKTQNLFFTFDATAG